MKEQGEERRWSLEQEGERRWSLEREVVLLPFQGHIGSNSRSSTCSKRQTRMLFHQSTLDLRLCEYSEKIKQDEDEKEVHCAQRACSAATESASAITTNEDLIAMFKMEIFEDRPLRKYWDGSLPWLYTKASSWSGKT